MKTGNLVTRALLLAALLTGGMLTGCKGGNDGRNPSGSLEATEVDVVATTPGRIVAIAAALGQSVEIGDTLVVLDTDLLRLQRAQAEVGRKSLRAQVQVLRAQEMQAETNFRLAETSLARIRTLLDQGSATQQQLDEVQAKRDVAAAQVSALQSQVGALMAEDEKLLASLAVFDRQLTDGVILAPITGTVILRATEPGEMAAPGAVLLRLADLSSLELRVYLGQAEVGLVKLGQDVPVIVDAFPDVTYTGRVTWISPEAEFTPKNAQTREARTQLVYAMKLAVSNPDGRLHIGMPAEVKLSES